MSLSPQHYTHVPTDTSRNGLFIAMSDDRTFQLYRWEDIIGKVEPKTASR